MKTKRIPFNVELTKAGARVVTRCGYPVRLSDFNVKNKDGYTLLGIIDIKGNEVPFSFLKNGCRSETEESDYDLFIEEEVKCRPMTNRELAWWLRDCPCEHREYKYKYCVSVCCAHSYSEASADEPVTDKLIRTNNGEWQEPLVEIEEDQTMLITLDKFGNELNVGDKVLCPEFIPSGHGCQIFRGKIDKIVHQNNDVYQIYVGTAKGSWMFLNHEIVKYEGE